MKNVVICKSCNSENPFYGLICSSCKSYLRERIYNIDLFNVIGLLIESPSNAFRTIIFSEHKNYVILLILFVASKLFLNGIFLTIYFNNWNAYLSAYVSSYFVILLSSIVLIIIFSILFKLLTNRFSIKTKFRDNYSILIYSFIPYTFGFLILFPVELIIFGETLFYYNPSPFLLKPVIAYALSAFEAIIIIWSIFLTFKALNVQSGNIFYSLVFAIFIHSAFYITIYFISNYLYL